MGLLKIPQLSDNSCIREYKALAGLRVQQKSLLTLVYYSKRNKLKEDAPSLAKWQQSIINWILFLNFPQYSSPSSVQLLLVIIQNLARQIISKQRWTIELLLELVRIIQIWREQMVGFPRLQTFFDDGIKKLVALWTFSFAVRLYPRPYQLRQFKDISIANIVLSECQHVTNTLAEIIPNIDHLSQLQLLHSAFMCTCEIANNYMTLMPGVLECYYLDGNLESIASSLIQMIHDTSMRMASLSYCHQVIIPGAAPCALLRALNPESLQSCIDRLLSGGTFAITWIDPGVVELSSLSLLDIKRRERFCWFDCERPQEFDDDFIVTFYLPTSLKNVAPSKLMQRHCHLNLPPFSVLLSTRNAIAKKRFQIELGTRFGMKLVDYSLSPAMPAIKDQGFKFYEMAYGTVILTHCWMFFMLDREGFFYLCPKLTNRTVNFFVLSAFEFLMLGKSVSRPLARAIWRATYRIISRWIEILLYFYWANRMTRVGIKSISAINYATKLVTMCPFADAYDSDRLRGLLDELEVCYQDAANNPEHHFAHTLILNVHCLRYCRQKLNGIPTNLPDHLVIGECIGSGTCGVVYTAFDYSLGRIIALKEIEIGNNLKLQEELMNEVNHLRYLRHQNVVRFYGAQKIGTKLYIKTEYCNGGSLYSLCQKLRNYVRPYRETTFQRLTLTILLGLTFLHSYDIVHGDLKPANILLHIFGYAKLADFGAARTLIWKNYSREPLGFHLQRPHYGFRGTPEYMAPETLLRGELTTKSDIWSLGCTLFHVLTGKVPWHEQASNPWSIIKAMAAGQVFAMDALEEFDTDDRVKNIIKSCLKIDPAERPTSLSLFLNPYWFEPMIKLPFDHPLFVDNYNVS